MREAKVKALTNRAYAWVRWAINQATEANDFISAIHGALGETFAAPEGGSFYDKKTGRLKAPSLIDKLSDKAFQAELRAKRGGTRYATPQTKLREIYENIDKLDLGVAMQNLLANQVEDALHGGISRVGAKGSRRLGNATGRLHGVEAGPLH